MSKRRRLEPKPLQQYEVVATPIGDGQKPSEATIDDESKRLALAKAMIENQKRAREQQCGAEIDAAIQEILKRYKCTAKFMELREGGQTTRIWLQPVALDEQAPG